MRIGISIIVASQNVRCGALVMKLQTMAKSLGDDIDYEFLVGNYGKTERMVLAHNARVCDNEKSRHVKFEDDADGALCRSRLAEMATMPWLLFLDSDVALRGEDLLQKYADAIRNNEGTRVIYGGVVVSHNRNTSLHYKLSVVNEPKESMDERRRAPFYTLSISNLLIHRSVMDEIKFDERYGSLRLRDVLFGKMLKAKGIKPLHIDNAVVRMTFMPNVTLVESTERAMREVHAFVAEHQEYRVLVRHIAGGAPSMPKWLLGLMYKVFGAGWRRQLLGDGATPVMLSRYLYGYINAMDK